jgi:hypothetical protein
MWWSPRRVDRTIRRFPDVPRIAGAHRCAVAASPISARELRSRRRRSVAILSAPPLIGIVLVAVNWDDADDPNRGDVVLWIGVVAVVQIFVTRWFLRERGLWRLAEDPPTVTDAIGVVWESRWDIRYKTRMRYVALYPPDAVVGQPPILTVLEPRPGSLAIRASMLSDGPPRPDAPVVVWCGPGRGTAWALRPRYLPPTGSRALLIEPPTVP